jgi:GT2 family glycosyltransferase
MRPLKRVAVIIPHYRNPEALARSTAAARAQEQVDVEIFVRDNSDDNVLYTQAINEGLSRYCFDGSCDYAVALNQDAVMRPNCLLELVRSLEAEPKVGIACPIQLSAENVPTWFGSLQAFPFGVHASRPMDPLPPPFLTYWANGACMVLRSAMVREIGLWDKNMRFLASDSDYSFTARARGWDILVVPSAQVEHTLGSSGRIGPMWLKTIKLQDMLYFARKWLTGDLYRSLALEGKGLDAATVHQIVRRVEQELEYDRSKENNLEP